MDLENLREVERTRGELEAATELHRQRHPGLRSTVAGGVVLVAEVVTSIVA